MEESELKEAVKFEMEHLLPEAIENYVIDFTVLDEYEQETDENEPMAWLKVQTAALPKNVVLTYLDTFEKAGLKIDIIDIQSNSIATVSYTHLDVYKRQTITIEPRDEDKNLYTIKIQMPGVREGSVENLVSQIYLP